MKEAKMKYSISGKARALFEQHGFDYDIAYLSAWYGSGKKVLPKYSPSQIHWYMEKVKHVPIVSKKQADEWLRIYTEFKCGKRVRVNE